MNELSLFTGAGGGLLATQHLLGWKTIGYVEIDDYCQSIIQQRIIDGFLDRAPIFSDVKAFINQGYAEAYKGMVDVITAGFPCQPFSVAGKQKGEQDERNLWPQTRDAISIVRPQYIYLENVPNLLTHTYIWRILSDITALGYDCKWGIVAANDVGAPHLRKRWWIVAYSTSIRQQINRGSIIAQTWWGSPYVQLFNDSQRGPFKISSHISMDDGVASNVDELETIGQGQVPRVVEVAWKVLAQERLINETTKINKTM